jgi:hypothetical protein
VILEARLAVISQGHLAVTLLTANLHSANQPSTNLWA